MSVHDEFDTFDLSEFTEQDFADIDAILIDKNGGPTTTIEVEQPSLNASSVQDTSPYQRYRRNKVLSVTDLVSLAWCEVQFDYGLRQKRSKNIDQRPPSFLSSKGKEIFVEKQIAARNDLTTKRGKSVHRELEREIWPEEVRVDIATDEERWALRLVKMLSGLNCLMTMDYTREMPVFGVLHDQVIVGVIDEVSRKQTLSPITSKRASESSQAPTTSKRIRRTSSPSSPLNESISMLLDGRSSTPPACPPAVPPYTLHLLDTKTRRSPTLPQHEDTLPSRLQLMLYHRLLANLISTPQSFVFSSLWTRLNLNYLKPFSARFMLQSGLALDPSKSATLSCLDDLARAWSHAVSQLDVVGVDQTLQILYRTQPKDTRRERNEKGSAMESISVHEEQAIARAIAESLKDIARTDAEDEELARAVVESLRDQEASCSRLGTVQSVPERAVGDQACSKAENSVGKSYEANAVDTSTPKGESPSADACKIIGTKTFPVDNAFLDTYLVDVLQWWHGVRPPRGVDEAQAGRCFTCEYREGCEWREAKSMEATKVLETRLVKGGE